MYGVEVRRLSLGGGVVTWGWSRGCGDATERPASYALGTGGWRDYVTLLHLPYTAWHLSYVVIGGCLAPVVAWGRLGATVAAFGLAVGVGAHALDELRGRPLRTSIPNQVLVALAAISIAAACAIGFGINFLLGATITSLAFWTTRVYSLHEFYYALAVLFSGQFVPLVLMPPSSPMLNKPWIIT